LEGLQEVIDLAIEITNDEQSVHDSIRGRCQVDARTFDGTVESLLNILSEDDARTIIGRTAHNKCWFKQIGRGEKMGKLVMKYFPNIEDTKDLVQKINALRDWVYAQ
jgi:hypothetical protein